MVRVAARMSILMRVAGVAAVLAASNAFAQGGSASDIRPVHEDPDGKLWVEYQTLLRKYIDPNDAKWVDHDHVHVNGCVGCPKTRPPG